MIVRVVIMYFHKTSVDQFLTLFRKNEPAILNAQGCSYLRLLKNAETPHCYVTWSHWDSPQSLEAYRKSPLFERVWGRVKPLFSATPKAFSFQKMD